MDAAENWYTTIKRVLEDEGVHEYKMTQSLFNATNEIKQNSELLSLHVDDTMSAGKELVLFKMNIVLSQKSTGPIEHNNFIFLTESIR